MKTADLGSFVAAARALEVSASAVGKAVSRLERDLGVSLIQRSTRRMQLTAEGVLFHERCREILDDLREAQEALTRSRLAPRGRLRVSAPIVGHHFLLPTLPRFVARYPEIELDIQFTDQHLDLIEAGVDVAVRSGEPPESRLVSRPLHRFRLLLCASPAYLARQGTPQTARDLPRHTAVRFRHPSTGKLLEWPLRPEAAMAAAPGPTTVLACNNIEAVCSATLRGMGIACMPDFLVGHELRAGTLMTLLDDHLEPGGQYRAIWPATRHLPPKVRVFIDHLVDEFSTD